MRGKYAYGERLSARGPLNHKANLVPEDYELITWLVGQGLPRREIAEKFGISKATMQRIIAGKHWLCRQEDEWT